MKRFSLDSSKKTMVPDHNGKYILYSDLVEFVQNARKLITLIDNSITQIDENIHVEDDSNIIYISHALPENIKKGRLLKGARIRKQLTQSQLAAFIKVPQSHISEYEKCKRKIPLHKAELIAKILDTSIAHFYP